MPQYSSPTGNRQRFRPEHRIRRRAHYQTIQQCGYRVQTPHFTWLLMPSQNQSRLGITATRRMGPAVQRNRIKRVLREVFRLHRHIFPAHCDIVVVPRSGTHTLSYEQVLSEIHNAAPKFSRALTRQTVKEQR